MNKTKNVVTKYPQHATLSVVSTPHVPCFHLPVFLTLSLSHTNKHMNTHTQRIVKPSLPAGGDYHLLTWPEVKKGTVDFQWGVNWVKWAGGVRPKKNMFNQGFMLQRIWILLWYGTIERNWVFLFFFIVLCGFTIKIWIFNDRKYRPEHIYTKKGEI